MFSVKIKVVWSYAVASHCAFIKGAELQQLNPVSDLWKLGASWSSAVVQALLSSRSIENWTFPPHRQWYICCLGCVKSLNRADFSNDLSEKSSWSQLTLWMNVLNCFVLLAIRTGKPNYIREHQNLEFRHKTSGPCGNHVYTTKMEQIIRGWFLLSGIPTCHFPLANNLVLETAALVGNLELEILMFPLPDGLILW